MNLKYINKPLLKTMIRGMRCILAKKLMHDALVVEGIVEITNGDIHVVSKNSIVDQGLIEIINIMACNQTNAGALCLPSYNWSSITNGMRIGSDTTHGTLHTMTGLWSPIGAGIGTAPNVQTGYTSNPSAGVFKMEWVSIWNAFTVSGTLGEVGLFLKINTGLYSFGANYAYQPTDNSLFSRMASADSKFAPFTIDNTKPLQVKWDLQLTYVT
jgi:hypothetical protein